MDPEAQGLFDFSGFFLSFSKSAKSLKQQTDEAVKQKDSQSDQVDSGQAPSEQVKPIYSLFDNILSL